MEIRQAAPARSVKVYFVDPIKSISVILDVLINLNFEVYSVPEADIYRLASLLRKDPRSIVYFCLLSEVHTSFLLQYIDMIQKNPPTLIQFGVFVSPNIGQETRRAFLNRGVATIDLYQFQTEPLNTLKKILLFFEAREKRKFVKAKSFGVCKAFFKFKNLKREIMADLLELSIQAFSCKLAEADRSFFSTRQCIEDVSLHLRGKQLKLAACFMGFEQNNPFNAIFLLSYPYNINGRIEYHRQLPKEIRKAIYDFILLSLKEELRHQLQNLPEERPQEEIQEL